MAKTSPGVAEYRISAVTRTRDSSRQRTRMVRRLARGRHGYRSVILVGKSMVARQVRSSRAPWSQSFGGCDVVSGRALMLPTTENDRSELLHRTAVIAQRHGHAPPDLAGFLDRYFQNVAMEDL